MRRCRRRFTPFVTVLLLATLGGCGTTTYKNATHANYGDAEYKNDLAQCRGQNSKVVTSMGYDNNSHVEVDEAKAQSCMNERGWQAVSR
jgi:hypothetical protein